MEKILIYIKHHFNFLWKLIEWGNSLLFSLLYKSALEKVLPSIFQELGNSPFSYRRLQVSDVKDLSDMIQSQEDSDLKYFSPHAFDSSALEKQFHNPAFLMMGAFDKERLAGYFFLRFFASKKCFVGRIIDKPYRGKGIGNIMNHIMYQTAWRMGFRCLSTISKNNHAVIRAHAKNTSMVVLKELQNDYLLVEFVK